MSDHDRHPPWLARILSATDAPPREGIARHVHVAPPQLFSDATNAIRLQFAREDAAAAGDDDDTTPKRVVTSRWRKVKLGLAFTPKKGARDAIAGANEVWADESSSEDEASILRDEDDDDEARQADRDEDEDEDEDGDERDEDENRRRKETAANANAADSVGKPGPSSSDARDRREASLVSAIPDDADVREIVWSFQNLDRVPPGLIAAVADRLRSLDLAHNALSRLPSRLALLEHLVELDVSHNRLERVPPALARCAKLRALSLQHNWIRKLGSWLASLSQLTRLRVEGNPLIDPPPAIVAGGVDHVKEYLRAARATRGWDPEKVHALTRRGNDASGSSAGNPGEAELRLAPFRPAFFLRFVSVATLDLRGARLDALPAALPNCASLRVLLVDGNALTDVPDCSSCVDLRHVSLSECRLSRLPSWLSRCARLETLVAARNALASPFPDLRACASLRTLDISDNKARELPRLPAGVRTLDASRNKIDDASRACDATDLRDARLAGNKITALPEDIAELHALTRLDLRENLLRDLDAPGMARRAPKFEMFWVSSNPLGATPRWFPEVSPSALEPEYARERDAAVNLRRLPSHAREVDLTDAALSHVPDLTARAACLTTLKLARNHLGFLPAHLSDCVALRVLHLDENRLSFLPDLSKMTRLEDLRARANRLVTLTPSVSKLTSLKSLYVGRNPLTSIPDVSTCANLETLWIAECRLVALPLFLADAPKLANFYCEGNPLKFPAPEVYERGGNDEVLRYLRSVAETERERRDMERLRKEMEERRVAKAAARAARRHEREKAARKAARGRRAPRKIQSPSRARGDGIGAEGAEGADERGEGRERARGDEGDVRGTGARAPFLRRERRVSASSDDGSSAGGFLGEWRAASSSRRSSRTQSSSDDESASESAFRSGRRRRASFSSSEDERETESGGTGTRPDASLGGVTVGALLWRRVRRVVLDTSGARRSAAGGDPIDMVLRARELKANIKLANASEEVEASERALRAARGEVSDADANLIRRVETVHEIRGQCAKQRELMDRYKSITEDVLRELQEKLRGAKRQLAEAVAWKELADAEVERLAAETEAKHAEAFAYRVEADDVAAEQRARGEARLLAKMARRREEQEIIRRTATEGAKELEAVLREGGESSVASRMAAARARGGGENGEDGGAVGGSGGYGRDVGFERADDATVARAGRAWGKVQMLHRLGVFRKTRGE